MVTLILLLWLIPIGANIYIDSDGQKPNYMVVFIVRAMAAIMHCLLLEVTCHIFPEDIYSLTAWEYLVVILPTFTFQVTSFWIFFEFGLNTVRGRELFYFDRKERDSGWIDKLFDRLGNGAHLAAKIVAFVVCVVCIFIIYQQAS